MFRRLLNIIDIFWMPAGQSNILYLQIIHIRGHTRNKIWCQIFIYIIYIFPQSNKAIIFLNFISNVIFFERFVEKKDGWC